MSIDYKAARNFANRWKNKKLSEDQFSQIFWIDLLNSIYDIDYSDESNVIFEYVTSGKGKIDVWLRGSSTMIEMKSTGVNLDKPEPRQGELKTPFKQVYDYAISFPKNDQPDYLITCNFETFRVYSRKEYGDSELEKNPVEFSIEDLGKKPEYLNFLVDPKNSRLYKEREISEAAGHLIGKLYDMLYKQYLNPDSKESQHALNVLCVRLVFCLFCEDAGLFNEPQAFSKYLADVPSKNIREALKRLFKGLDTKEEERDQYDIPLKMFPYVNGGLFAKDYEIPNFTDEMKDFLIHEIAEPLDWSQISPTIFGGIFESTLNPETRHQGGMHYTTVQSIHKVIDPLFLDDLNAELDNINALTSLSVAEKTRRYNRFRRKLASLTFFDPACGSGNFLTETYLSLRKLEDRLNLAQQGDQIYIGLDTTDESTTVTLSQFYGIEVNDFAVAVAETALWISRLKANNESATLLDIDTNDFPLSDKANITVGNALTTDWENLLPASKCNYIIGNPPFVGARNKNDIQSEELSNLMSCKHKKTGDLDYVSGWYRKATDYMLDTNIEAALVSTNSISQGEQVSLLWKPLLSEGITINYAYTTFPWDNEAAVHCIIIGFSYVARTHKYIYKNEDIIEANNISPYLIEFSNVVVEGRTKSICKVPKMDFGSMPNDDKGKLSNYSKDMKDEIVSLYPETEKLFRRIVGSEEYINNLERWCLWLVDVPEEEYIDVPPIRAAIEAVREKRANSKRSATNKLAATPMLFGEIRQPSTRYLLVPSTSSENREYIPMGFMEPNVISNNANLLIAGADMYHFGILTSSVHMAWMRTVCGRLKSDYRYSKEVVYNNFPWCNPTKKQVEQIKNTAQAILDVRQTHADMSLAEMYRIDTMPRDLKDAHIANDEAVLDAYGFNNNLSDIDIFSRLMRLYQNLIK